MRLHEKVALITGGGSGIGRVTAELFAREGARVAIMDWHLDAGQETANLVTRAGGTALAIHGDVSRADSAAAAVNACLEAFGRVDILFNNAGVERFGSVTECEPDEWDLVMAVNVRGTYLMSKYVLPAMVKGGGSIINVASVAGLIGVQRLPAYCAAKGAIVNLTRSMAVDFSPQGIRVNCIAPGTTLTPMALRYLETNPEPEQQRLARFPLRRLGQPGEIADVALFLASDQSTFMTGACLPVDGGRMAG